MIKFLLFFSFYIFVPKLLFATNIIVIDVEKIINNNNQYIQILDDIEKNQTKNSEFLNKKENEIEIFYQEIQDSKLLLNEDEINNLIYNYNIEYNKFTLLVEKFNLHYQEEVTKIRKLILDKIVILVENYAKKNNVDLILDSTSYIIASNDLNITDLIAKELNDLDIKLEFESFEQN